MLWFAVAPWHQTDLQEGSALCSSGRCNELHVVFLISCDSDTEVVLAPCSSYVLNDGSYSQYSHLNCIHSLFS